MSDRLRITGGDRRGRKLLSPPPSSIRPASDFLRQAVFNMISADVPGCHFYDIFAGTGVVGLEALSRGAQQATFIEREKSCLKLIHRNVGLARYEDKARIRLGDAFVWGRHFVPEGELNIVFLGPPYPLVSDQWEDLHEMIEIVQGKLTGDDYLILQTPRQLTPDQLPGQGLWTRQRKYGKSRIGIWRPELVEDDTDIEDEHDDPDHAQIAQDSGLIDTVPSE